MAHTTASIGSQSYEVAIESGTHRLIADEPASRGGGDAGPAPYDLLLSALGACTAMTLRMYADRLGWPVRKIGVDLRLVGTHDRGRIDRLLMIESADDAARIRLAEVAERTPVTLSIKNGMDIVTTLAETRHD